MPLPHRMTVALAVAPLLASCGGGSAPPPPPPPAQAVQVAPVAPASASAVLAITGTVRLKREVPLAFNTGGRIANIAVQEGDVVQRGQVLARLDPTSLAAARASAAADLERFDADVRRNEALFKQGWVTAPRVEQARATAAAARARLAQTGFDLGLSRLVSPGPGVILARPAEPGQIVNPGQQVLLLGEAQSGLVLRLPVADRDAARLRRGQVAEVVLPALPGPALTGIISEIGARGDDGSGTFRVEVKLPADPRLKSGLIGTARLALAGVAGPLKVPTTAVFAARADEGFVYVLADGRARQRLVGLGPVDDAGTIITRGLSAGEQVITTGIDRLRPDMAVTVAR